MTSVKQSPLGRAAEVLLVDDDHGDAFLAAECFAKGVYAVNLHRAENGEAALSFLRREGVHRDAPFPDLVLLDINMPRMNGWQVMDALAADDKFNRLPVVVMTTSAQRADIDDTYRRRCNSYIVKPHDFEKFQRVIHRICAYWFDTVELPNPGR